MIDDVCFGKSGILGVEFVFGDKVKSLFVRIFCRRGYGEFGVMDGNCFFVGLE